MGEFIYDLDKNYSCRVWQGKSYFLWGEVCKKI